MHLRVDGAPRPPPGRHRGRRALIADLHGGRLHVDRSDVGDARRDVPGRLPPLQRGLDARVRVPEGAERRMGHVEVDPSVGDAVSDGGVDVERHAPLVEEGDVEEARDALEVELAAAGAHVEAPRGVRQGALDWGAEALHRGVLDAHLVAGDAHEPRVRLGPLIGRARVELDVAQGEAAVDADLRARGQRGALQPPDLEPFARELDVERGRAQRTRRVHLRASRPGGRAERLEPFARERELRVDELGAEVDRAVGLREGAPACGVAQQGDLPEVGRVASTWKESKNDFFLGTRRAVTTVGAPGSWITTFAFAVIAPPGSGARVRSPVTEAVGVRSEATVPGARSVASFRTIVPSGLVAIETSPKRRGPCAGARSAVPARDVDPLRVHMQGGLETGHHRDRTGDVERRGVERRVRAHGQLGSAPSRFGVHRQRRAQGPAGTIARTLPESPGDVDRRLHVTPVEVPRPPSARWPPRRPPIVTCSPNCALPPKGGPVGRRRRRARRDGRGKPRADQRARETSIARVARGDAQAPVDVVDVPVEWQDGDGRAVNRHVPQVHLRHREPDARPGRGRRRPRSREEGLPRSGRPLVVRVEVHLGAHERGNGDPHDDLPRSERAQERDGRHPSCDARRADHGLALGIVHARVDFAEDASPREPTRSMRSCRRTPGARGC